jgi:hypothetical protein
MQAQLGDAYQEDPMIHVTTIRQQTPRSAIARGNPSSVFRMAPLAAVAALLLGCVIPDESTPGASGEPSGAPPAARLPDPDVRRVNPRALTPDEQKRQDEAGQYLADRYQQQGWRIVATTQTYLGDIIDWVDPASVPGSQEQPPPKPSPEEMQLPEGVQLQVTELDMSPELRGPDGTIPIYRPSFAVYVSGESGASSVDDFITNHQESGRPDGKKRLYAGLISTTANQGVDGWVNQFVGDVEPETFSLIEVATLCRGTNEATTLELVGAVASRDKVNFGDAVVRLQVEFFTAGSKTRDDIGGWDGYSLGLVPAAGRPYSPGLALVPLSTVNGVQYESLFHIQRFGSNWWVGHNGNWLGYYPGSLFDLITSPGACEAVWYGEVFDPSPTDWTSTDMGSGLLASSGLGSASYVRSPFYFDSSGILKYPDGSKPMGPIDAACYTRSDLLTDSKGEPYFFLGGPGGDAPGCD